jgi:hypothetical protein
VDSANFVEGVKNYYAIWDLSTPADAWLRGTADNYGVLLEAPVSDPRSMTKFSSNDEANADQRPYLEVCYAPGISLEPDNASQANAGDVVYYAHTLTVGSLKDENVDLSVVSDQGWTIALYEDENGNGGGGPFGCKELGGGIRDQHQVDETTDNTAHHDPGTLSDDLTRGICTHFVPSTKIVEQIR